jgi:DNA-binding MarR family transcriptional regulator
MPSTELLVAVLNEWHEISRRNLMSNLFMYARDYGLTMAQFGTLLQLHHRGACGVSNIGNELGVTNSAASQMLERLVQLDLVARTEDPKDRRVKLIVLTEKSRQILHETNKAFQSWLGELADSMTSSEQEEVWDSMNLLIEKAHQLEVTPA